MNIETAEKIAELLKEKEEIIEKFPVNFRLGKVAYTKLYNYYMNRLKTIDNQIKQIQC